jgi:CBS domain containing-hemolysin-like protein
MTLLLIYLSLALFVSFMCSILEAVLLSSTNSYIETLSRDEHGEAIDILKNLKANIDRPISSILTFNTFAHTMGAAGVGAEAQKIFGSDMQAVIAFILTLLILYVSEIVPKTIGAIYWKKLLISSAYFIEFLIKITYPFVWLSARITNFISKGKNNPVGRFLCSGLHLCGYRKRLQQPYQSLQICGALPQGRNRRLFQRKNRNPTECGHP